VVRQEDSLQTSTQTVETAWKVGAEVAVKTKWAWEGVDGKLVGDYSKKTTDTDTFSVTTYISPGYTAEASTYVDRDLVKTSYYGVWVRIADGVRCPGTILLNCAKYEWKPNEYLGNIDGLKQRSGEQTFKFLIYVSGQRPAYKLEAD
jgi:membrane carboxypeptidase/penicillin-binding protein